MANIDSLVDKFINYSKVNTTLLNNYINMYGKDATYLKLEDDNNIYLTALGKDKIGFDYNSESITKVPTKIICDYGDWFQSYTGAEINIMLYFSDLKGINPDQGDIISYTYNNKQLFYRITQPVDTYGNLVFKTSLQLIQSINLS